MMHRIERATLCVAVLLAAMVPESASADAVEDLLAPYSTKRQLYRFLHDRAPSCAAIDEDLDLCSWRLTDDRDNWELLADAIDASERFALACVFLRADNSREPGSCQARVAGKGKRVSTSKAEAALEGARTFLDVARLVGTSPDSCTPAGMATRTCIWQVSSYSPGYELVAGLLQTRKKLLLTCKLPDERHATQERAPGSCTAQVGDR
jgi:hypothetical protein